MARLSCFRDETVGGQMDYTLQTTSGYRWKDGEEMHWSDPANQQVQDYLIGLMTELAQMGFDEIMLEHWSYPTEADGPLSNIQYGEQSADEVSRAFLEKAFRPGVLRHQADRGERGREGQSVPCPGGGGDHPGVRMTRGI